MLSLVKNYADCTAHLPGKCYGLMWLEQDSWGKRELWFYGRLQ